jgi:hypothetical protein
MFVALDPSREQFVCVAINISLYIFAVAKHMVPKLICLLFYGFGIGAIANYLWGGGGLCCIVRLIKLPRHSGLDWFFVAAYARTSAQRLFCRLWAY